MSNTALHTFVVNAKSIDILDLFNWLSESFPTISSEAEPTWLVCGTNDPELIKHYRMSLMGSFYISISDYSQAALIKLRFNEDILFEY